jgi:hypothetical protein
MVEGGAGGYVPTTHTRTGLRLLALVISGLPALRVTLRLINPTRLSAIHRNRANLPACGLRRTTGLPRGGTRLAGGTRARRIRRSLVSSGSYS